jgi:hypothetical protein
MLIIETIICTMTLIVLGASVGIFGMGDSC